MTIRFEFDRSKLTEREAQIVDAMIGLQMATYAAIMTGVRGTTRETGEFAADAIVREIRRHLPDIGLSWTWEEPSPKAPAP